MKQEELESSKLEKRTNCPVCNADSYFLMFKEEYPLFECQKCSLVFVFPQPSEKFLREEVYSFESGYQSGKEEDLSKFPLNPRWTKILDETDFLGKGLKILDVGCSVGDFLYEAKKRGHETFGVEMNYRTFSIAKKNGLNVLNSTIEEANFGEKVFDVIFLGDIIEHVKDPKKFVDSCKRVLKNGGVVIVRTPNLDCFWSRSTLLLWKNFNMPWSSVTPPHHLSQFSINNLNLLFKDFGFSVLKVRYERPPRLMYEIGSLHLLRRFKKTKKVTDLAYMFFTFFLYTILYFFDFLATPLKTKDASMTVIYKKHD